MFQAMVNPVFLPALSLPGLQGRSIATLISGGLHDPPKKM
jgi:hypothetical protein